MSEGCGEGVFVTQGTTRLTFTASDGTEYQINDQIYAGQAASSDCNPFEPQAPGASRGTVFATEDGMSGVFVSDTTIFDHTYTPSGPRILTPSGYLTLGDGARMRIDDGLVTWLRDKNGNKVLFTYEGEWLSWRITSATDSLNRQITFQYNFSDPTYGVCDRIIFKGVGGAQRIVRIVRTSLGNALIAGDSLATYHSLFPGLDGSSSTNHNPDVVSAVWMPDGRGYQLRYNRYGELCRVELPTGGSFEYSWTEFPQGWGFQLEINRRVTERRTYTQSGALASKSTYGGYVNTDNTQGTVQSDHYDFNGALLAREKHYFHGHPFSYTTLPQFQLPDPIEGREYKTEHFASNGTTVLRRLDHTWFACGGPCLLQTVTTLEPASANLVSKQTFSYAGSFTNRTDVYEYGFGVGTPGPLVRRTHMDYLTTNPVNGTNYATTLSIRLCSLPDRQQVFDGAGVERARTTYEYDNYTTDANHAGLVNRANISGLDSGFTTSYATRGNVTGVTRHLFNTSGSITGSVSSYQQYDIAGNVVKAIDARGYATSFDFSDRYGAPDGNAQANSSPTELGSLFSYAFATKVTNPLSQTAYSQFDFYSGEPVDAEDLNAVVSSLYYNDLLDRLTQVRRAVGTSASSQTTFSYDDANRIVTTTSDLHSFNDNVLTTKTLYDGLGRTTESRQYEGSTNYIATQTQYDALDRPFKTSNPFRPWKSETAVWTTQAFDALGRITSITSPDNAVLSTAYNGNTVKVTDAAGKGRKSVTDALGRLIEIYEDPDVPGGPTELNYLTSYTYDVLDNLVKVTQGTQQRFFMYDSLKRLIRARNPEQSTNSSLNLSDSLTGNSAWSVGYQYDANSNLTQKIEARGVVSTYAYDPLNRNTTIDYSDTASINPDVKRFYDGATNGKGRIWYHYSGGDLSTGSNVEQTTIDSYDAAGRPLVQRQLFKHNGTWSAAYQTSRTYNRAGAVTSQTYPSGHSVTYNYDSAGRLADKDGSNLAFSGNLGGAQRTYASENTYSSWGSPTMERFGTQTPFYHKRQYNIRGQLFDTRLSSVNDLWDWNRGRLILYYSSNHLWGQSGTDNNGNVHFAETWIPPENATLDQTQMLIEQAYSYDALNRLSSVTELKQEVPNFVWQQQFQQAYSYDRWGNRNINAAQTWGTGINNKVFAIDTATNRLGVPGGQSGAMTYDNAGNLTTDTYTGAGTRTYDAENKMTAAQDSSGGWSYYTYNADGQRTRRKINNQETWQIYGLDGELLAEYPANGPAASPQKEYGYRNGQLLITANPGALTNFALNKTATQSSTHASGATAGRAVDGNIDGVFANGSVTHTLNDVNAWWQVDLGQVQTIDTIKIWNRVESPERLANFYVFVSDQPFTSTDLTTTLNQAGVSNFHISGQAAFPTLVTINRRCRYIRVQLAGTNYLSIAELQVLAITAPANVALNKTATQSSTHASGAVASRAVDGNTDGVFANGSVTHTLNDVNAWWQVDLGQVETIGTIKVWNRIESPERLSNFYVFVSDQPFTSTDLTPTQNQAGVSSYHTSGQCGFPTELAIGRTGRYVRVQLAGTNYLSIAEVQVLTGSYVPAVQWLVSDHVGTARIILDQTGSRSNVKRHDYLPFGEELFAGTGGRTTALGYADDGVRQQFTSKERDVETGLDYFNARYYSPTQGRYTSIDPMRIKKRHLFDPRDLNRYVYVANNPLAYIDPDGLEKLQIIVRTFIPQKQVIFPLPVKGDGRGVGEKGTSRTELKITVETNPNRNRGNALIGSEAKTGLSEGPVLKITASPIGGGLIPTVTLGYSQANGSTLQAQVNRDKDGSVGINAKGSEPYPGIPATPAIDFNFNLTVRDQNGKISVALSGQHDGFPAYEIFAVREGDDKEQKIHSHDPRDTGQTGLSLFGEGEFKIKEKTVTLEPATRKVKP